MNALRICAVSILVVLLFACREEAVIPVEHFVVIGVDGLSPDGIRSTETPNIDRLISAGAHTFTARAMLPTTSPPNWASMIMGISPEVHGILEKRWDERAVRGRSTCGNATGELPTNIFRLVRAQHPAADVVAFYEWAGIGRLLEHSDCTRKKHTHFPARTVEEAEARIAEYEPLLLFLQFLHVDNAGHRFGYASAEYFEAVATADEMVGKVLTALERAGIRDRTVVLVTADHGGVGTTHGGDTPAEMLVPWIIAGPGIARGVEIDDAVQMTDTAATVAAVLAVDPPDCWTGRPVTAAFAAGRFVSAR